VGGGEAPGLTLPAPPDPCRTCYKLCGV
jgi:hypothetical protein